MTFDASTTMSITLAGPRQFGRFDPAHRTDIDVYSVPQLIVPSQIGQDMPGRHRRNARDPKRHVS